MNGIDDNRLLATLSALPLGEALAANPQAAIDARNMLTPLFGPDLARRFMITMLRITRANVGLRASGRNLRAGITINTVGESGGYLSPVAGNWSGFSIVRKHVVQGKR